MSRRHTLRHFLDKLLIVSVMIATSASLAHAQDPDPGASGIQARRDYFMQAPFDHADPLTGGLVLQWTDLVLPGNAGRELRVQRTFSSKGGWTFGLTGIGSVIIVWDDPYLVGEETLYGADGAAHELLWQDAQWSVSDQYWKYDRIARRLYYPDGSVAEFDWGSYGGALTAYQDVFGNRVTLTGWGTTTLTVTQLLGNNEQRVITLHNPWSWNGVWTNGQWFLPLPAWMTYNSRTWTYQRTATELTAAISPEGTTWSFSQGGGWGYGTNPTLTVTTPNGGTILYVLQSHYWWLTDDWGDPYLWTTWFLVTRTASPGGTTSYAYQLTEPYGGPGDVGISHGTVVTAPSGTTTTYAFASGWGLTDLVSSRTVRDAGGTELENEARSYQMVPPCSGYCVWIQNMAELATHTITRNGRSYSTQYIYSPNNNGDYRHPSQIIETGDFSRHTWRYYTHTTTPYLLALLSSEYVQVGAETWMKTWYYNANGFLTEQFVHGLTTWFAPDAYGNVASMTRNGHTTTYAHSYGVVSQITLPNTDVITRSISADGLVLSETRAGRTTGFTYDNLFRLTSTQPPGGGTPITTQYFTDRAIVTRGPSVVTTYVDGFGRPTCMVNSLNVQACTTYDADGHKASESLPASGTPTIFTTFTYDGLGRLTGKTNPDATYVAYTYDSTSDALTVSVRDENAHVTLQALKGFGHPDDARLARVTDALNNTWTYTYNALGNLTRVDAPGGLVRTWTYDASNRLQSETQPESGTVSYTYISGTALLYTKTDAKGTVFTHTYDANDRLTQVTAGGQTTTITYEAGSDNRASAGITGGAATTFNYDTAGRLSQRSDIINGATFSHQFAYNALDRLTTLTYPSQSGRQVGYEYDAEGRIARAFNAATQANYASSFSYHPSGAVAQYTAFNGLVHQFVYQPLTHRLDSIGVVGIYGIGYVYDAAGNVTRIDDTRGSNWTQWFGYDALDRLTSATGIYGVPCYAYDTRGNRTNCGGTTYAYDANERLITQGNVTFAYDANGSTTSQSLPAQTYTYTPNNLMATMTQGGSTTSYFYDADTWRMRTLLPSGANKYAVRGPNGKLLMEWDGSAARDSIYARDRLIAWVDNTGVFDVTTDTIGSIRMVTNASQTIVERHDFLPFGEEWNPPSSISPVKFAGKERDAETGFDYFGARYNRGVSGRFTSVDPVYTFEKNLVDPQRWNRYAYTRNNPFRYIDLKGQCVKKSDANKDTSYDDICQETAKLKVDKRGEELIRKNELRGEKPRPDVYRDSGNILTVGIGHKVLKGDQLNFGDLISEGRMNAFFGADLRGAGGDVRQLVGTLPLSQNEFNALADLVFNVGLTKLRAAGSPELNKAIREGDYEAMSKQLRYTKDAKGDPQQGLVERSDDRKALFVGTLPR